MFLLCVSGYLLAVSVLLLFLRCASYNVNPNVLLYESKLSNMYELLFDKIKTSNKKISFLAHSNSCVGSIYRVLLSKEYLLNERKYQSLNFSDSEDSFIQDNIIAGLKERVSIFTHMHITICILMVVIGSSVGIFLRTII